MRCAQVKRYWLQREIAERKKDDVRRGDVLQVTGNMCNKQGRQEENRRMAERGDMYKIPAERGKDKKDG